MKILRTNGFSADDWRSPSSTGGLHGRKDGLKTRRAGKGSSRIGGRKRSDARGEIEEQGIEVDYRIGSSPLNNQSTPYSSHAQETRGAPSSFLRDLVTK